MHWISHMSQCLCQNHRLHPMMRHCHQSSVVSTLSYDLSKKHDFLPSGSVQSQMTPQTYVRNCSGGAFCCHHHGGITLELKAQRVGESPWLTVCNPSTWHAEVVPVSCAWARYSATTRTHDAPMLAEYWGTVYIRLSAGVDTRCRIDAYTSTQSSFSRWRPLWVHSM